MMSHSASDDSGGMLASKNSWDVPHLSCLLPAVHACPLCSAVKALSGPSAAAQQQSRQQAAAQCAASSSRQQTSFITQHAAT